MTVSSGSISLLSIAVISLQLATLLTTTTTTNAQEQSQSSCSAPTGGCASGLWSTSECKCQCLSPFCPSSPGGPCTVPGGDCISTNHWASCEPGVDCPFWKSITEHNSCATGPVVPAGVYDLFTTNEDCCTFHFPEWSECRANLENFPALAPSAAGAPRPPDSRYENVPIKFTLSGLPDEANMQNVKAELLEILKRVLYDLAERVQDLKITNVEENLVLTMENAGNNKDPDGTESVFYDITLLQQPGKKFGPTIIAGLEESKDLISQHIKDFTDLEYFDYSADLILFLDEDDSGAREKYRVMFRLADLPVELNVQKLIRHIMGIYLTLIDEREIENLDIVGIEQGKVTGTETNEGDESMEVYLDVVVARKSDIAEFGPVITEVISREGFKNDVLDRIQTYTDTSTDLDLNWCINDEDGAYAVCPPKGLALPIWAIITLTIIGLILACCICICITKYQIYRNEYRNERNLVTYIETGQHYRKQPNKAAGGGVTYKDYKKKRKQLTDQRNKMSDSESRRQRQTQELLHQPPTYKTRRHRGDQNRGTGPKSNNKLRLSDGRNDRPQTKRLMIGNGEPPRDKPKGGRKNDRSPSPNLALPNGKDPPGSCSGRGSRPPKGSNRQETPPMKDRLWDEEEQPQPLMITNDTNYQMDNMPSFIFNDGGNDKNNDGLPPPPPRGPNERSEQSEMLMLEGNWFVDEESVLTPSS